MLGITLRYPYEVRKEDEYFADIPDEKIPKNMLELSTAGKMGSPKGATHQPTAVGQALHREYHTLHTANLVLNPDACSPFWFGVYKSRSGL
jgi:hypothetical protein